MRGVIYWSRLHTRSRRIFLTFHAHVRRGGGGCAWWRQKRSRYIGGQDAVVGGHRIPPNHPPKKNFARMSWIVFRRLRDRMRPTSSMGGWTSGDAKSRRRVLRCGGAIRGRGGLARSDKSFRYRRKVLGIRRNISTYSLVSLSRIAGWYENVSLRRPWSTAFITCAIKGMAADLLIQIVVEGKKWRRNDWKRTLVFSSYGAFYCGWWQHFLYNIAYRRLFGTSTALFNAARTVLFDSVVHVPFVIFPVYYVYKALLLGGNHGDTAYEGLCLYANEALTINMRYYSVWIPANMLVFTVVPVPFRIGFIATTSFAWLSLVSFMTLRRTGSVSSETTPSSAPAKDYEIESTKG